MTSVKCFISWMKEAGRGHLAAFLGWGAMILYGLLLIGRLSFDTDYNFFGVGNLVPGRLMAGMGLMLAFLEFFYLFQQKKQDFYYSLPVKKSTVFWSRYVHGIFHSVLPLGLVMASCGLYQSAIDPEFATFVGSYTGKSFLAAAGVFLIFYHIGILSIIICGSLLSALPVCAAVILYFRILTGNVLINFASDYFYTYYRIPLYEELRKMLSPFDLSEYLFGRDVYEKAHVLRYTPGMELIMAALGWIVILFLLILWAQRKRKTEGTGRLFALAGAERTAEILVSFLAGVWAAGFFADLTGMAKESRTAAGAASALLAVAVAFAAHCLLEGIIKGPGKKMFRRKWQMASVCAAAAVACAAFPAAASSYDTYFPAEASGVSVSIDGVGMSYDLYLQVQGDGLRYETDDQLEQYTLTGDGRRAALGWLQGIAGQGAQSGRSEDNICTRVTACYYVGERSVYRTYPVTWDELESFAAVYETQEYKEKAYPAVNLENASDDRFTWDDGVTGIPLKLTGDEKEGLLAAYREDISELTMEELSSELPCGNVKIKASAGGAVTEMIVYPFFKRTCDILEEAGVDTGKTFRDYPVESVEVRETLFSTSPGSVGGVSTSFYETPEEIEEWKQKLVPSELDVQPVLYPLDRSKEIKAVTEDPETNSLIRTNCVLRRESN